MIKHSLLGFALAALPIIGFSQALPKSFPEKSSAKIIDEAIELHDDSLFQDALDLYKLISPNDSNYSLALAEMSLTLNAMERYEDVIALCEKALKDQFVEPTHVRENLAIAYDEMDQSEEALRVYEEGIKFAPMSHLLYYNKGITHKGREEYKEAVECFQKAIEINPKHASSHYALGMYCLEKGELITATFAFGAFFQLEPASDRANNALWELNEALSEEYDTKEYDYVTDGNEDFADLEEKVREYVALSDDYKIPTKLRPSIIKQMHYIFSNAEETEGAFYSEVYVPYFKQVAADKNLFKGFSCLVLLTSESESHQRQIMKDKKKAIAFIDWASIAWPKQHEFKNIEVDGKNVEVKYWRLKNGTVDGYGQVTDAGEPVGDYKLFHYNGCLSEVGRFNQAGQREGEWLFYYQNGLLKKRAEYTDGDLDGNYEFYENDGTLAAVMNYDSGDLDGERVVYFPTQKVSQRSNYDGGLGEGKYYQYYPQGQVKIEADFSADELDGDLIKYYVDGSEDYKVLYEDGKRQGEFKEYYDDGTVYGIYTYADGELDGDYIVYYRNKQVRKEGKYKEGAQVGMWKYYHINGDLDYTETYDESGKQNGVYTKYDYTGRKVTEMMYDEGELAGYKMFDENGTVTKSVKAKKGKFMYEGLHANRAKAADGMFEDGKKIGQWHYYNEYGKISSAATYYEGEEDGKLKYYYANGKLESTYRYREGSRHGLYQGLHRDGAISRQGRYVNGDRRDRWMSYTPDGTVTEDNFYRNDVQNGWQSYYNNRGQLTSELYYREGLLMAYRYYGMDTTVTAEGVLDSGNGMLQDFFPGGQLMFQIPFENGVAHGDSKGFYPNGKKRYTRAYINDEKVGEYKYYYMNGKVQTEGLYKLGRRNGEWKTYHENGQLYKTTPYVEGEIHGTVSYYSDKGILTKTNIYSHDEYDGPQHFYNTKGELQMVRYYTNGILEKYSYAGTDGNEIEPIAIELGNGDVECKYANGQVSRSFSLENGQFEGEYKIYYPNGQMADEFVCEGGQNHGEEKEYYEDGTLKTTTPQYFGLTHGTVTEYHSNGKVKSTTVYVYDEQDGEAQFFDKSGKLTRTEIWFNGNLYAIQ